MSKMFKHTRSLSALQCACLLAYVAVLVFNALANTLPLGGRQTGEISGLNRTLFEPAGFTFGIWGVIYLFLGFFVLFQAGVLAPQGRGAAVAQKVGVPFVASCLANIVWLLAWHNNLISLSLVVMLALLGTLLWIYMRLRAMPAVDWRDTLFVRATFSMYLGWISVALIANTAITLVSRGMMGFGILATWLTLAVILVAIVLAMAMLLRERDRVFAGVVAWALLGILARHMSEFNGQYTEIVWLTALGIALLAGTTAWQLAKQ
ncbi:MAG: hypothetical protein KGZ66_09680 [Selenomonadales bacterium]|nr:hypothetical protein [Selenomonadales bacterium]